MTDCSVKLACLRGKRDRSLLYAPGDGDPFPGGSSFACNVGVFFRKLGY